jgi:ribonuclease-3
MSSKDFEKLEKFQEFIRYNFQNDELLKQALTTPSFGNEQDLPNYEILEMIGDVVLKLIIVLKKYNEGVRDPGEITRVKQQIENNKTFRKIAKNYFTLDKFIIKPESQKLSGTKILADVLEAICGAIFLDSNHNLKIVKKVIVNRFYPDWNKLIEESEIFNKNTLLEFLQANLKKTPKIELDFIKKGQDDNPIWIAENPKIYDDNGDFIIKFSQYISKLKSNESNTIKEAEQDIYKKIYTELIEKLDLSS